MKENSMAKEKQLYVLSNLFNLNKEIGSEFEAQKIIYEKMLELQTIESFENYNISVFVKDSTKVKWKTSKSQKDYFTKIFNNEINSVKERYGLKRHEVLFLYSLSEFVLFEFNLLVDENGFPLNQKALAEKLELTPKAIRENMKNLEKKKCVLRIYDGKDVFYLVNPFLMFKGTNINKEIPELFKMLGYESM